VLKTLDILIGIAVVMLVVSMAVTMLTQFFLWATAARGRKLLAGLSDLMEHLHPGSTREEAEAIAKLILTNPAIRSAGMGPWKLGDVIHRDELTKLLLDFGSGNITQGLTAAEQAAVGKVVGAMKQAGINDPQGTLENVRAMALRLEKQAPQMAANVRHSMALVEEASSAYLAKINFWFDQTMDRVSSRFTGNARFWTFVSAVIVAVVLQLDLVTLVNRLSMDDQLRASLVKEAIAMEKDQKVASAVNKPVENAPATDANTTPAPPKPTVDEEAVRSQYFSVMAKAGIVSAPTSWDDWKKKFSEANPFGVVIAALLLSLGAPFWYSMLGKLLQLRSIIAQKDDAERDQRQTTQPDGGAGTGLGSGGTALPLTGESGDLAAIG
jgi:hypothetical protein